MIFLDYQDRRPIYEQIVERFQQLIVRGALEPGSQMPSVRQIGGGAVYQSQYHSEGLRGSGTGGLYFSGKRERELCGGGCRCPGEKTAAEHG